MKKNVIDRRKCLKLLGLCGLSAACSGFFIKPAWAAEEKMFQVSRTLPLMGTLVNITVYHYSRSEAALAQENAFQTMKNLIPIFDRFNPDSHISQLNTQGILGDVPPDLFTVMKSSEHLHKLSNQAFDITILPLLELQKKSLQETGRPPSWSKLQNIMPLLGADKLVKLSKRKVQLCKSGAKITLDGIAKGYIVDRAAATLRQHGIRCALINAGGDIRAVGGKEDTPWMVGIKDPQGMRKYVQKIRVRDMAIATSGNYENYFDSRGRHHHLIDSAKGGSPRRTLSASVLAPTTMMADGLSTAFFILSPEKALNLAKSLHQVQTYIIVQGGRSFMSPGWKNV